ncbi:hypothetical protein ACFV1N_40415 [Streptosporangium canum]|uniref:hypothetical protein n=1 Tax=Streptosporangium canum TaxID=324952 RepID=UPI00367F1ABE
MQSHLLVTVAARAEEVLALDADDLDLRSRRTKVRRKGGAVDVIVWRTATAHSCPAYRTAAALGRFPHRPPRPGGTARRP